MRVLLVARDVAPSNAFKKLGEELARQGGTDVDVRSFLGSGKDIPLQNGSRAADIAEHPCVVLTGMSSSAELAKEEIAALEVGHQFQNPIGCYADAFGAFTRPWFAHLRDKINFLFVLNEKEAEEARPLFPNANVVVSGNPTWDDFFAPKMSRADARARLGVDDGRKVLVCIAAGKVYEVNMLHLGNMISAVARMGMLANQEWHIVFSTHPGDEDQDGHYKLNKKESEKQSGPPVYDKLENLYAGFKKFSKVPITIATKALIHTSDALSAADVVVDSASTSGLEAAARNIPVVEYMSEPQWNRVEEQTGKRRWELVDQGCVPLVEEIDELAVMIRSLLVYDDVRQKYLTRQQECYPRPKEIGVGLRIMAETLCGVASKI